MVQKIFSKNEVYYSMFQDKTLICKDCGSEFIFTAGEQEFYAEKGFTNEPQRCKACRNARKNARGESSNGTREMFDAVCAECPSSPERIALFTAVIALQTEDNYNHPELNSTPYKGVLFFFLPSFSIGSALFLVTAV